MLSEITFESLKASPEIDAYITGANDVTFAAGYTEHGLRHASLVANIAKNVLLRLGYPERQAELAAIAGYLHDIGNVAGRMTHGSSGALMAWALLREMGMSVTELLIVTAAIGSHDAEEGGYPINDVSAALILADKSDVHRSRVRNSDVAGFDIHDRVNHAVKHSFLRVDEKRKTVTLELRIDTAISPLMDYFEIFLTRMLMCRRAAAFLKCTFELVVNDTKLL